LNCRLLHFVTVHWSEQHIRHWKFFFCIVKYHDLFAVYCRALQIRHLGITFEISNITTYLQFVVVHCRYATGLARCKITPDVGIHCIQQLIYILVHTNKLQQLLCSNSTVHCTEKQKKYVNLRLPQYNSTSATL
jgi:hypothetical protein